MTQPRWVIHLPTTLTTRAAAENLAAALRHSLAHLNVLDFGETTLSQEDHQNTRHRVYCDQRLPSGTRCPQPHGHTAPCERD